jgi:hypothetical protein
MGFDSPSPFFFLLTHQKYITMAEKLLFERGDIVIIRKDKTRKYHSFLDGQRAIVLAEPIDDSKMYALIDKDGVEGVVLEDEMQMYSPVVNDVEAGEGQG